MNVNLSDSRSYKIQRHTKHWKQLHADLHNKLGRKMAELFDGANRCILFIQVLALLVSVCFTSPLLQSSENPPRQLRRSSPEGNAVSN